MKAQNVVKKPSVVDFIGPVLPKDWKPQETKPQETKPQETKPQEAIFDIAMLDTLDLETLNQVIQKCLELKKSKSTTKQGINQGVGNFIKERILNGTPNKDILKEVHEHYGNTNTTYACVAWYRNDMKNKGLV